MPLKSEKLKPISFRPTEEERNFLGDSPSKKLHLILSVIPILRQLDPNPKKAIRQLKKIISEKGSDVGNSVPNSSTTQKSNDPNGTSLKKGFLKSIQEDDPPYVPINPMNPFNVECHYHAYNPKTGKHFCDGKEIDPYVCANRYQRYLSQGRKCYPQHWANNRSRRKTATPRNQNPYIWRGYPY